MQTPAASPSTKKQKNLQPKPKKTSIKAVSKKDEEILPGKSKTSEELLKERGIKHFGFHTHDETFFIDGETKKAGLYRHYISSTEKMIDEWVCSPIHIIASTDDGEGSSFGLMINFLTSNGKWRKFCIPMEMTVGSARDLIANLMDMGMRISNHKNPSPLIKWLIESNPLDRVLAVPCTGWHDQSFVLPKNTIGDQNIILQTKYVIDNNFAKKGTLESWKKEISELCKKNPLLQLSICIAFAGPLLKTIAHQHQGGFGIHLLGDSSQGKSTAQKVAASVWGPPAFVRSWRATSNGLEATAASLNDTLLVLDEINEANKKEIGETVYMLANGVGKQRALRNGEMKKPARWRIISLSSGEESLSSYLEKDIKMGQVVRLLNIPSTDQKHGLFCNIHDCDNGENFSNHLRKITSKHYGCAGMAFLENLIEQDFTEIQNLYINYIDDFKGSTKIENRAGEQFALLAVAGEMATKFEITNWKEDQALECALFGFKLWKDNLEKGKSETTQILNSIRKYIDKNGDSYFSSKNDTRSEKIINRAGYWIDDDQGRVYLFFRDSLIEAAGSFDLNRITKALNSEEWIFDKDNGRNTKKVRIHDTSKNFYHIRPKDEE